MPSSPHSQPPANQNPKLRRIPEWSSLPDLAVFTIATRLDTVQFKALAGVCKSWRTICTQNKPQIVAHHPPLLLALDLARLPLRRPLPVCHLYNFPDHRLYTKPLPPRFQIRGFDRCAPYQMGCFYGYIVLYYYSTDSASTMYLANPFSEELIELPPVARRCRVLSALLTAPPASADSVLVAFTGNDMMVCRPGVDDSWSDVRLTASVPPQNIFPTSTIEQAVFFKGLVYIVKKDYVITVEVKFGQDEEVEVSGNQFAPFHIEGISDRCRLLLFVGEQELFAVETVFMFLPDGGTIKRKYRLRDGEGGSWEEVESLGGLCLFTRHGSKFVPVGGRLTGWDQWGLEDRVFYVQSCIYSAKNEGDLPSRARRLERMFNRSPKNHCWVSPRELI